MNECTICDTPAPEPNVKRFSRFYYNLRVHWRNWWNRGTAKAYRKLTQAMKDDPNYALSWQCNIAMTIFDNSNGKLTLSESNEIADRLMKHLFGVKKPTTEGNQQ